MVTVPGGGTCLVLVSLLKSRRYSTESTLHFPGASLPPTGGGRPALLHLLHARARRARSIIPPPPSTSAITLYVCVSCIQ